MQQKEVDFLNNENQLLEGYLQRVSKCSPKPIVSIVGSTR